MSDNSEQWLDLLRELDADVRVRARERWAQMTDEEREAYAQASLIRDLLNMP